MRGPYPLGSGLLAQVPHWGVSCHEIEQRFDSSVSLAPRASDVASDETHETLDVRTQMASAALARQVARHFKALWTVATPQGERSYAAKFADADRTLDFTQPVARNLRIVRAFGRLECLAVVNDVRFHFTRAAGWLARDAQRAARSGRARTCVGHGGRLP